MYDPQIGVADLDVLHQLRRVLQRVRSGKRIVAWMPRWSIATSPREAIEPGGIVVPRDLNDRPDLVHVVEVVDGTGRGGEVADLVGHVAERTVAEMDPPAGGCRDRA